MASFFNLTVCNTFYLFICWWTLGLSIANNATMNMGLQIFLQVLAFNPFRYIARTGISGSNGNSVSFFAESPCSSPQQLHPLSCPPPLPPPLTPMLTKPSKAWWWLLHSVFCPLFAGTLPSAWRMLSKGLDHCDGDRNAEAFSAIYKCLDRNSSSLYSSLPFFPLQLPTSENDHEHSEMLSAGKKEKYSCASLHSNEVFQRVAACSVFGCWFVVASTCLAGWIHICNSNDYLQNRAFFP